MFYILHYFNYFCVAFKATVAQSVEQCIRNA